MGDQGTAPNMPGQALFRLRQYHEGGYGEPTGALRNEWYVPWHRAPGGDGCVSHRHGRHARGLLVLAPAAERAATAKRASAIVTKHALAFEFAFVAEHALAFEFTLAPKPAVTFEFAFAPEPALAFEFAFVAEPAFAFKLTFIAEPADAFQLVFAPQPAVAVEFLKPQHADAAKRLIGAKPAFVAQHCLRPDHAHAAVVRG